MKTLFCRLATSIPALLIMAAPAYAEADKAHPFFPDDLQTENKITLTPGFTPDGQTMFFAQSECFPIWECPQRLKRSTRTAEGWTAPELVDLPVESRVDYPSVTPDGSTLLFSWMVTHPERVNDDTAGNFDLWQLDLTSPNAHPDPLEGPDLNRVRAGAVRTLRFVNNETAPNLTTAGDLYFWGERLDGIGDRDAYVARSDGAGGFIAPELLPAPINSTKADDGLWVSPDGKLMLITYSDRGGCGGSDLFQSRLIEGKWTEPVNLGCDINSPFSEYAASVIPGTEQIVFPSDRPTVETGKRDVQLWTASLPALNLKDQ